MADDAPSMTPMSSTFCSASAESYVAVNVARVPRSMGSNAYTFFETGMSAIGVKLSSAAKPSSKAKLRGSGLEPYVEVVARIDTDAEKRLVPVYRLEIGEPDSSQA